MFKRYKNKTDYCDKLGEIIANNLEKIKISTPEEAEILASEIFGITWHAKSKLKPETLEKLKEARQKLVERLQAEEQEKEVKKNK